MKTLILFTLFALLSSIVCSQKTLTKNELAELQFIRNYDTYLKYCNSHQVTPKTETDWILEIGSRTDNELRQNLININNGLISSGTYLKKARNRLLIGYGCGILSGIVLFTGSTIYTNQLANNDWNYSVNSVQGIQERQYLETQRSIMFTGAGVLLLTGLAFEISGIGFIGKAGISLNEHGVGVKVNF